MQIKIKCLNVSFLYGLGLHKNMEHILIDKQKFITPVVHLSPIQLAQCHDIVRNFNTQQCLPSIGKFVPRVLFYSSLVLPDGYGNLLECFFVKLPRRETSRLERCRRHFWGSWDLVLRL